MPRLPAIAIALGAAPLASGTACADEDRGPRRLEAVTIVDNPNDPRNNVGSTYVITASELKKHEHTNVHSVLRQVPGVYVRDEDGLGTFPRIGIRASSGGRSDRLSLMEDGIPAAMAPYANPSAYYFPTIGRMRGVEVLKGPEVLLYGPQTTSGALNLLSTAIPDKPSGFVNTEVGRHGSRRLHAGHGTTAGQWGVSVETYQWRTDGFQDIDRSTRTAGTDLSEYMARLRWRSAPDAAYRQQVDVKVFKGEEDADVSYLGLTDADFRADPERRYGLSELERMNRGRESASVRHQIAFGADTMLATTVYAVDTFRYYKRLNQINGVALGGVTSRIQAGAADAVLLQGILDGSADTTHANGVRYGNNDQAFRVRGIQFEWLDAFATGAVRHELTVAARLHDETTLNADRRLGSTVYQQVNGSLVFARQLQAVRERGEASARAFWIADRIRQGDWTLLPVIRHERIETQADLAENASPSQRAARASNSVGKSTAGLGVNYALGTEWTLIAGIHQGFAPPGNSAAKGAKGEESLNHEAGARFRRGASGVDAIGFYSDYRNALRNCLFASPCASGATSGTESAGKKKVYGLELGMFTDLYTGAEGRVPARLAYTYTGGRHTASSEVAGGVLDGDALQYTPRHVATLQVGIESASGWSAWAALNYTGPTCSTTTCDRPGVDPRLLQTESLFTVDLSASYPLARDVDVYAKLDNLFDQRRIVHRGADGARGNPGRYAGVGLRVRF